jgi:hypothetical protein
MRFAHPSTALFAFVTASAMAFNHVTRKTIGLNQENPMSNPDHTAATLTIDLDADQLLVIDDRAGTRMQVLQGGLWLTEPDSLDDRFARAGQWLAVEHRGRAIAQSLGRTRVRMFGPPQRGPAALWRRAARSDLLVKSIAAALAVMVSLELPALLARGMHPPAGGAGWCASAQASSRLPAS